MENKEIQEKLSESAKEIPTRDFDSIWEDVKRQIEPRNRFIGLKRLGLAFASLAIVAVVVLSVIFLPQIFNRQPQIYYQSDLEYSEVDENTFYAGLNNSPMQCVSFNSYATEQYTLYQSVSGLTLGGSITLNNEKYLLNIVFYSEQVEGVDIESHNLTSHYENNGIIANYRLKESIPDVGIYVYEIKASFNGVNYFIDCTYTLEDVTLFFTEFFVIE